MYLYMMFHSEYNLIVVILLPYYVVIPCYILRALVFGLHLWLCDTVPPGPQYAVHIYYVKFTCKRICWDPGGGGAMLKNIFYFLYV